MSDPPVADAGRPRVLILGGGFGGLSAARRLAGADAQITLVDRRNHHLFQPLLYQVATASLSATSIAAPLRHILRRQRNLTVLMEEVTAVDLAARRVDCGSRWLDYDWLVIATGATHAYFGHDEWAPFAPALKTLDDAQSIRRRVLLAFEQAEREDDPERRQAWLNFVVVGGGSTGVELAGTLIELARHTLRGEFRHFDSRSASVRLVEAGPRLLAGYDPVLSDKARRQLERLGVQVHTGAPVTAIDAAGVNLGERRLPARTVLWAAGVAASSVGTMLGAPLDKAGRVRVDEDLGVPGHAGVFVIGDLASVVRPDGSPVPGVAPAAKQMGEYVGAMIARQLHGDDRPQPPFRYRDAGSLATIGRMAAVAQFGKLRLSGLPAWIVWLLVHIYFLIGFRNRLAVMLDWAWAYWTHQRQARIVSGTAPPRDD
ncbi:NAD(P)/FAD-dependent oxidoreductase [Rhodanobacter lindaniclasticus]|uniref:FAD-dependent oxidoreductase n=1 Tax=Rhodanobacter lindaniclasticus TaxID=75310 RepID=A0A4V3USU2_9GAMM|nr:NAD(P)/FAD-dependent oxidoreductase [Rhodanobacter lindaniclasticus]THD07971.1 FAD-dependent oxidoreductase [Rhodanobacter lindaniclasticus]